ncbi:MAG: acetyl-CoA carboxylase carboxyltransferase subunit beta, partial [Candidatus Spyradenecus sp.]
MAWFTKAPEAPLRVPTEALWNVCKKCGAYTPKDEYVANLKVCPHCGAHGRLSARERIDLLADKGSFQEIAAEVIAHDPLTFRDATDAYADKVVATREKTKIGESIVVGTAKIEKIPVVLGAMDFRFMGGSLGSGTGERILQAAEKARELKCPLILCTASGGARMQEGIVSLMQMAKTSAAIQRLRD